MALAYRTGSFVSAGNASGGDLTINKATGAVDGDRIEYTVYFEPDTTNISMTGGPSADWNRSTTCPRSRVDPSRRTKGISAAFKMPRAAMTLLSPIQQESRGLPMVFLTLTLPFFLPLPARFPPRFFILSILIETREDDP